jgi:hypothetical protein
MNDYNNISICTELGVDSDLVPFLDREGVSLQEIRCYHHWRRGSSEADLASYIGISIKAAEAGIIHIQQTVPRETLDRNISLRNEILAINIRSEKRQKQFEESFSKSAKSYIEDGCNPVHVLQNYRKAISEDYSVIEELRVKDGTTSIHEKNDGGSLENDLQKITQLRNQDEGKTHTNRQPREKVLRESEAEGKGEDSRKKRKKERITIRIENVILEKLQKHTQSSDLDLSKLVRNAIAQYLEANSEV